MTNAMDWTRSFWIAPLLMAIVSGPASPLFKDSADSAVIVNSGSTNIAGFRITVARSGQADYIATPRRFGPQSREKPEPAHKKLPRALAEKFFSDLERAQPLSSLPQPHCMKSASFGSNLRVEFGDEKTPDLSCGDAGSDALQALIGDVKEITALFSEK